MVDSRIAFVGSADLAQNGWEHCRDTVAIVVGQEICHLFLGIFEGFWPLRPQVSLADLAQPLRLTWAWSRSSVSLSAAGGLCQVHA